MEVNYFLFFDAAASGTFARFFPKWKARCDYGLLIFILTFCLISVSGYRDDEVIDIALTRLSTVMIGGSAALAICILLFPVWAGEDLHHLVADNIEKLGDFLEGNISFSKLIYIYIYIFGGGLHFGILLIFI